MRHIFRNGKFWSEFCCMYDFVAGQLCTCGCVCLWKITSHFSSLRFSIECMNKSFELRERKQLPPTFNSDRDRLLRKSSRNIEFICPFFVPFKEGFNHSFW